MSKKIDKRPPVAIGHVRLPVNDVKVAHEYLEKLGLRSIVLSDTFAVMELRGGTHLIVSSAEVPIEPGSSTPIDLMVDDLDAAKKDHGKKGFKASKVSRGSIHDTFLLTLPDGYELKIFSSHAGNRVV